MERANKKVICALDTPDLDEAIRITRRLSPYVGAFKIGHVLTLPYGLDVIDRLQDAGASRIFLDLKFHDIPNTVALAVCEAARRNVWMLTLHIAGGPAMLTAAVEEANNCEVDRRPLLIGVSVLTSLDQNTLSNYLGIERSIEDQMVYLSKIAMDCELDGVVCSAQEIGPIREAVGHRGVIVTPGIRLPNTESHDQRRVGDARTALQSGADYLVIGRALIQSHDVLDTLAQFGLLDTANS
ncbi:MAG TPA: orotidine-5'-phosphate decarboxylase [Fimbriimonas sp.]|nr:orotidine-5'-phosphate decarboxylase [Fimbriimonas sp.]